MSNTIDQRIVQATFENSQFDTKIEGSIGWLDKLKKSLNFDGAAKSFENVNASAGKVNFGGMAEGIQNISSKFSAMGIFAITTLTNIANSAYQAGARIVKALTIDPIMTGLNEYETKLNSVQTILANTQKEGTTLAVVTDALNRLNEYSDKTIYNFQEMTRNVGTFTASGIKLEDSVQAIKGIANLAALSGSNSQQASTAMYQLSQALSTGTLRLQDWNSVVNAGLGGQVFQDALMETARLHGIAVDQMIKDEGSFRNSLQRGWITSEVLTETLQKFTGDLNADQLRTMGYTEEQIASIIKMAQTANDAATKVKTFSQLFDTLKEAAQSGWAQTWEIIIGDFNEAKSFLTDLNNWFGGILGSMADARNSLLGGWKDLGGRTALLESLKNVLNAIVAVVNPIKEAFRDIFPATTANQLYTISLNIRRFTENLIIGGETASKVKKVFKAVFAIFDIGKILITAVWKEITRLVEKLVPLKDGLGGVLIKLSDFIIKLRDSIKSNNTFEKVLNSIGNVILFVGGIISTGVNAIMSAVARFKDLNRSEGFLKSFMGALGSFFSFFKNLNFDFLTGLLDRLRERLSIFGKIGDFLKDAFSNIGKKGTNAENPFINLIKEIVTNVIAAIKKMALNILEALSNIDFSKFSFKGMFDTLNSGLLGGLLLSIIQFVRKGNGLFGTIVDVFKGVSGFAENANGILASITTVMTGVKDIMVAWQQQIRAGILMKIAGAIGILALSLIGLSLVDSEKLTGALAAVTGLFADLFGTLALYEKVAGGTTGIPAMAKGIGAMLGLSAAVLILSGALVNLSRVPTEDLVKGISAITALTVLLAATAIVLSKNASGIITGSGSIIIFSLAIRSLIGPVKDLGALESDVLTKGLTGLAFLMAEIVGFMKIINGTGNAIDDIIAIGILSLAINDLSGIVIKFADQDTNSIVKGLSVMAIILAELMAFTKISSAGSNFVLTATGMLILSGALFIIADVLNKMSSLTWEELAVGLTALAGSLLILGVAVSAMSAGLSGSAAMIVAALALAILVPPLKALGNMDLKQVGIALLALAGVFTIFGIAGYLLTPVVPVIIALAGGIALFGVAILAAGVGIGAFAAGLALLATVGAAAGTALGAVLLSIAAVLPILAIGFGLAIIAFAKVIKDGAPVLFEAGRTLLYGLIGSVTETLPTIIDMILTGIDTFLIKVTEKLPSIIESGYKIMLSFLNGMSNNIEGIVVVVADIITKFLNSLAEKAPELVDSGWNFIISWIDGITKGVEEHLPELMTSVQGLGLSIVKGVIQGLLDGRQNAINAIKDIGNMLIESFKERLGINSPSTVFIQLAGNIIMGLINGIRANVMTLRTEAQNLANNITDAVKEKISTIVNSGRDLVIGLANGIKSFAAEAIAAAVELATQVLNAVKGVFNTNSPSKETFDIGGNVDKGLAGGITKFASVVLKSVTDLGNEALSGFNGIVSKITNSLDTNMNTNPTIQPVLDLTEIQNGSNKIDGLLGGKSINLSTATLKAASVSAIASQSVEGTASQQNVGTPTIQLIQNNTSPKALSAVEIYRQTNNQISRAKEMLNKK